MALVREVAELVQGEIGKEVEEFHLVMNETELILISIHAK